MKTTTLQILVLALTCELTLMSNPSPAVPSADGASFLTPRPSARQLAWQEGGGGAASLRDQHLHWRAANRIRAGRWMAFR